MRKLGVTIACMTYCIYIVQLVATISTSYNTLTIVNNTPTTINNIRVNVSWQATKKTANTESVVNSTEQIINEPVSTGQSIVKQYPILGKLVKIVMYLPGPITQSFTIAPTGMVTITKDGSGNFVVQ
ncbi:MAG: hypothetical protein WCE21_05140 [Candidatus Babeliales bacterium]